KLLDIKSRKSIMTATCNAEWIVYANYANIKAIYWTEDFVERVKVLHDPIANVKHLCLTADNRLVLSHGRRIETFRLDRFGVVAEHSLKVKSRIHQIAASEDKIIVSLANE